MKCNRFFEVAAVALALTSANIAPANAIGPAGLARQEFSFNSGERIREGRFTLAPFSYVRFCSANPDDCRQTKPQTIQWNYQNWIALAGVNWSINRTMQPVYDKGGDIWSVGGKSGDCEDFALTKRRELIRQGIPSSALRIAVALTPEGEGHAVLVARTTAGDFVLDNRTNRLLKWNQTDLSWIKIASAGSPLIWRSAF
jgi:predicted transglutaminase-like cysteine proteinase